MSCVLKLPDIEESVPVAPVAPVAPAPYKKDKFTDEQWNTITHEMMKANIQTEKDLYKFRLYFQSKFKLVLSNSNFIKAYNIIGIDDPELRYLLVKKKNKSNSGVIVVTVLTAAHPKYVDENGVVQITKFSCAWNCHYCPNEKASIDNGFIDQPRSYLFQEPAVLRANHNHFDPVLQFRARINTLIDIGHIVDKVELIVLGGTWCSYPHAYQEYFITQLYYAANTMFDIEMREPLTLGEEIKLNESAKLHVIGLTLETRPDTINIEEIKRFRRFNATRIQLGVQHTDNKVLKKINRGHTIECAHKAIRMLKENGYKVDIHLMPNLPGSSYEIDADMLNRALWDDRLQVDQLKIYPCAVVPFTKIKEWFDEGSYVPYDDLVLFNLIKDFKKNVQTYKRLNRIIRDIPSTYISGGYTHQSVNMRQLLQDDMKKENWKCQCIRCREIKNGKANVEDVELKIKNYRGSEGDEYFISFETDDYLIGFIRLRINTTPDNPNILKILHGAALIRELHVYSNLSKVGAGKTNDASMQHRGYGQRLLKEAERIAMDRGIFKFAVISGTGVRGYYRKHGYELKETYMIKELEKPKKICAIQ